MGALIGVRAILRDPTCFSAAAFTSPMFALNLSRVKSTLVHVLARGLRTVGMSDLLAPGQSPVPYVLNTAFHDNALTSDPEQYEFYKRVTESLPNDKIGGVTYGWVSAALREVSHLAALSKPLPISSAFLFGTKDQIIDRHGSASLARYLSNSNVTEFPNAKHDILFERPDIHSEAVSDILSTFSVK